MKGAGRILVAAWLLAAAPGIAGGSGEEPGLRRTRTEGVSRLDVVLPGRLISYALPRRGDGAREIVALVAPPAGGTETKEGLPPCPPDGGSAAPPQLFRIDPSGGGELRPERTGLPADATALDAFDLDGDGDDELLLGRPGEMLRLEGEVPLRRDPDLRWNSLDPTAVRHPELAAHQLLPVARLGRLELHGPRQDGGWGRLAELGLPSEARLEGGHLVLRSPVPRFIGRRRGGSLVFALFSEAYGERRVRTRVIEVLPSGTVLRIDAWSRLPGPEEVLERRFLLLDDRPHLLAATRPSERLGLFGEKRLRLFELEPDRSRLGSDPVFAAESRMNLWQDSTPVMRDVDGDGLPDLVLGYWKGLLQARAVLDVYRALPGGGFRTSPRTTAFDVKDGDRSFLRYGPDLDGDGRADLLLRGGGALHVHRGLPSSSGKNLVEKRPQEISLDGWEPDRVEGPPAVGPGEGAPWRVPSAAGRPRVIDLDGDQRLEILLVRTGGAQGPGAFRLLRVHR